MPVDGYYYVLTDDEYIALSGDYPEFVAYFTEHDDDYHIYYVLTSGIPSEFIMLLLDDDIEIPTWRYTKSTQWETGV